MKILHLIANLATRYGGPSQAILGMTKSLVELGNEVTIFTTNQDGDKELDVPLYEPLVKDGVNIVYFPIQNPRFFGTSLPMARHLKKALKNHEFDIVHIHSLYLFHGAVAASYCRRYNIPYIIRPHGTLDPFLQKRNRGRKAIVEILFENRNLNYASALHYTTEEEKVLARPFVGHDRGFIVPNGLYLEDYLITVNKGEFRNKHPQTANKKIILFFSRLNFKKGLDILIEAYSELLLEREDIHLVITGPDNDGYGDKVRQWIEEKKIESHVTFTGMLTGLEKHQVLRDADVFVLPSYSENFGISVIEAMISGLPVIISNKVNIYRELLDHEAGEVVNCDPIEVRSSISRIIDDNEYALKLSRNGYEFVSSNYDWNKVGLKLYKNYELILSTSHAVK
ncbi:hypothetical protein TCA2_3600 [Paenibacillus sp. TCA20]|uniref:glycosyltransferase n=1 Tax=Paenibacillus sp. TCA20 TaxID=1499968 RepID=UPI0004D7634A|nr:glycosyltransferase [Paenibacillus sp. TCA20]GAK41109.1 hypothetical protein TCA2_3600 [Paenibacillus sp. TCA20]